MATQRLSLPARLDDIVVRFAVIEQLVLNHVADMSAQSEKPAATIARVISDLRTQFSDAGELDDLAKAFVYRAQVQLDQTEARLMRLAGVNTDG